MADDEGSPPRHHAHQIVQNACLGVRVDGTEGVVQDENSRVASHGAGQRSALLLPPRQIDAPLTEHRSPTPRELLDRFVELRDAGRLHDDFVGVLDGALRGAVCPAFVLGPIRYGGRFGAGVEPGVGVEAQADVLFDGRREKEWVLRHHADERA